MGKKSLLFAGLIIIGLSSAQDIPKRIHPPVLPPQPRITPAYLENVKVEVQINDRAAETTVDALFKNPSRFDAEAEWLFPIPPGAYVHKTVLFVDGKEIKAETLDSNKARTIYESIVAKLRDPLLLEYAGWGLVRARIYPVPAGKSASVHFAMSSLLPESGGVIEYKFPFKGICVKREKPKFISCIINIKGSKPIGAVYSPNKGTEVKRISKNEAKVGWEVKGKDVEDLTVYFTMAEKEFGLLSLFYPLKSDEGIFMFTINPKREGKEAQEIPKTVVFVVDTSGSMQGRKIEQVKKALKFFISSLRDNDAFNIVSFATDVSKLFPEPSPANEKAKKKALEFVSKIEAEGGTNLHDALVSALDFKEEKRMPIILFLTDGLPTIGETDPKTIIEHIKLSNKVKAKIFVFGVGKDVNAFLLDKIAYDSKGDRHYISEDESIEVKVSSLLKKISHPALSDPKIKIDGVTLKSITPNPLPNLFYGSSLVVIGKYFGTGKHELVFEGKVLGEQKKWVYDIEIPNKVTPGLSWLEPLWAQRRIAFLIDEVRLNGPKKELINEIKQLGKKYGIVTPWTSHLVAEETERITKALGISPPTPSWSRAVPEVDSGGGFLGKKRKVQLKGESNAPMAPRDNSISNSKLLLKMKTQDKLEQGSQTVKRVANKTFIKVSKSLWVDSEYKKDMELFVVKAFSKEYFEILHKYPIAAKWFAVGKNIIVVIEGKAYKIIE